MKIINSGYEILSVISDSTGGAPSNERGNNSTIERIEKEIARYFLRY